MFHSKPMSYTATYHNTNNNNVTYVLTKNKTNSINTQITTPTYYNTPQSVVSNNNNNVKRLRYSSSENICKRRRVSPLSINTVKSSYPVYVQHHHHQQQPIIVTNYYKPQVNTAAHHQNIIYNHGSLPQPQQTQQQRIKQTSKQKPVDINNQFPVTQVSEVFQGCSELSLPKLVIYLIYKIWCCCSVSQYKNPDTFGHNNGSISSKYISDNTTTAIYSTAMTHAMLPSPISPSNNHHYFFDCQYDKVNVLYKNIYQSKIFQEQATLKNEPVLNTAGIDVEKKKVALKNEAQVDPKDFETQILKACSRSCRGELKNNYSKLIDYVDHLLKITQISFSSVILALEYIYRLKEASQTPEGKFLNQWSYEEIIPVAFMMANKFISDDRYSNTVWANVTNISLKHLNELEMKGLVAISFRLYVSESNYKDWLKLIKNVSRDLTLKYEQRKQPKVAMPPVVSYNLSPNPFFTTSSSSSSFTTTLAHPNSNTAIYSPLTPSKVRQTKNHFMVRNPSKPQVIPMMPQNVQAVKPSQLLPNLPMSRVIKNQSSQSTLINIPVNHPSMPIPPFQGSTVIPKGSTTSNQSVLFFPKINNVKPQSVVRQNICAYPVRNTIYPSPPLSRTASPTPDFIERYLVQNKNVLVPPCIKTNYSSSQIHGNPFIKGFK